MRIVLEVGSGPQIGHKRFLGKNQVLEVGRSALVDLSIEGDARMSGRHFRIITGQDAAHVEDLTSSNGTHLRGEKIHRAPLHDLDVILAGDTLFTVRIEGTVARSAAMTETAATASSLSRTSTSPDSAPCTASVCENSVFQYSGSISDLPPAVLAERLATVYSQMMILDVRKLSLEWAEQIGEAEFLFDWLPPDVRAKGSPRILTSAGKEQPDPRSLVEAAWGKDTLVCVYAAPNASLPLAQIRRCAGAYARPSLLRPQLTETVAEVAQNLLLDLEAVFVEDGTAESWLLYSPQDLKSSLGAIGLAAKTT